MINFGLKKTVLLHKDSILFEISERVPEHHKKQVQRDTGRPTREIAGGLAIQSAIKYPSFLEARN